MKILFKLLIAASFVMLASYANAWNANSEKEAREAIAEFQAADKDIASFFSRAHGYAVYPTVGKAGLGIGGAHGKGVVFEQGVIIGSTSLTQLSFGFQWGGQAYSEVVFFQNKAALDDFKKGNYELGAQVSAVAITAGASADANYDNGVAIFTLAKGGLMYEASVGGQKFKFKPN